MPTVADYHVLNLATGIVYERSPHNLLSYDARVDTVEFENVTVLKKNDVLRIDYAKRFCKFFMPVKLTVFTVNRNKKFGFCRSDHDGQFFLRCMARDMDRCN